MKRNLCPAAALPVLFAFALVGCEATKSENPLSPSVAGPIAGVDITPPTLIEPGQGFKVKESQQPLKLLIGNSTTTGVRAVAYSFEVATDSDFQTKVFARSGVPQGSGGQTSVTVDRLDLGRAYYWRVRADDGANSSSYSTASFEVLPKPVLNAPSLIHPINGATTGNKRPELKIANSDRNAAIGFVRYGFQISTNASFTGIVATGVRDEGGSTTEFIPDADLAASTTYYWRAAAADGETTSAWSAVQNFKTPGAAPAPAPGPAPNPGAPCDSGNPDTIIKCERNKYGFMSPSQTLDFLRASARSLNRNGIGGGPFGILRKTNGANCNGFSCDIICAGQGGGQVQYDVLADAEGAQVAGWGGGKTAPNIRADVCEIQ